MSRLPLNISRIKKRSKVQEDFKIMNSIVHENNITNDSVNNNSLESSILTGDNNPTASELVDSNIKILPHVSDKETTIILNEDLVIDGGESQQSKCNNQVLQKLIIEVYKLI